MTEIIASNITKLFGRELAIKDLNFNISSKNLAVLGTNGSGKTTLLSMIAGLSRPSNGTIKLNGIEPFKERDHISNLISLVFEKPSFPYNFRVGKFLDLLVDTNRSISTFGMNELWSELDSIRNKKFTELSSGEGQILYLASAIYSKSKILVLDEPFNHLDMRRAGIVIDALIHSKKELIITSHIPEEAEFLSDFMILLDHGKLIWSGYKKDLFLSDFFEVFGFRPLPHELDILCSFGNIQIVKSSDEVLAKMMKDSQIIGYRKLGVRRKYAKI